jgi:hypothetical protein
MKNIIFICCLIAFSFLAEKISAQAPPQKMTYQFVARNAQNQLIQNNAVGLRISILQGAPNGNAVYVETHTPQTNGNGTATIEVGGGTPVSGVFANIDWSTGVYFIQTEMDPQGQQGYSVSAVSQLLTVPYAFYAARSTRATFADSVVGGMNETDPNFTASVAAGITPADTARWNQDLVDDADNNPTNELQTLSVVGDSVFLSNGGYFLNNSSKWKDYTNGIYYDSGNVVIGNDSTRRDLFTFGGMFSDFGGGKQVHVSIPQGIPGIVMIDTTNDKRTSLSMDGAGDILLKGGPYFAPTSTQQYLVTVHTGSGNLDVEKGDVMVESIGKGIILKSPNGSCWRVTVDNTGNLVRTAITCP